MFAEIMSAMIIIALYFVLRRVTELETTLSNVKESVDKIEEIKRADSKLATIKKIIDNSDELRGVFGDDE